MTAAITAKRIFPLAFAALVVLGIFTASASGRTEAVHFVAGNARVVQGNEATVTVTVQPAGARARSPSATRAAPRQSGLPAVTASGSRATWTWQVPRKAKPGPARVTASCAGAGRATTRVTVIGQIIPPKITVVKTGWSVRPYKYGGAGVSYGVILANESTKQDALDVTVLTNFVMADNRLIGSASSRIGDIAAGTQHALGGGANFPGGAPIDRIEVVVKIGKSGPATHTKPGLSASPTDFAKRFRAGVVRLGRRRGSERQHHAHPPAGRTVGCGARRGGQHHRRRLGLRWSTASPAARVFFKLSTGLSPIAYSKAASALVSVVPTYLQTP